MPEVDGKPALITDVVVGKIVCYQLTQCLKVETRVCLME